MSAVVTLEPVSLSGHGYVALTHVALTCEVTPELALCNAPAAVREAVAAGEPFAAHEVMPGYRWAVVLVNPAHVVLVRPASAGWGRDWTRVGGGDAA